MSKTIIVANEGNRKYIRVSRWIKLEYRFVTCRHRLYDYADVTERENGGAWLYMFRHGGRLYALNQFARLGFPIFYGDAQGKMQYLCGYDTEQWYKPLICEIEDGGECIRLYQELIES
jgi:hypothetical protein